MGSKSSKLKLPGYTLPLNHPTNDGDHRASFPNGLDPYHIECGYASRMFVQREILMMQVMNTITDKPEWEQKVFDNAIVAKWRDELAGSGQDITPRMTDWIIKELQWKAGLYRKTGYVMAYLTGVVKSDSAIPVELKDSLREAVRHLEDIPETEKDYHPGSDRQVVDLVHPSLFPVIYGRSRILPDRLIGVDDCLDSVGLGEKLEVPLQPVENSSNAAYRDRKLNPFSLQFQWMPCDVEFTEGQGCHFASYINNLHPQKSRPLYEVIEKILAKTIPLWNSTLTHVKDRVCRVPYCYVNLLDHPDPEPQMPSNADADAIEEYWDRVVEWEESNPVALPDPDEFKPPLPHPMHQVDLRKQFSKSGLQVIVKLANIQLTPESPNYNGGSWHIEGQLNEHICATALYYYDSHNITENHLSFRQRMHDNMSEIYYPQGHFDWLYQVFGLSREIDVQTDANITQALGDVSTREGRLLTFPNILQHRVSPFSLADKSKPGHRKILALFLVDPQIRIISSANIPPQNTEWWTKRHEVMDELFSKVPVELRVMIEKDEDPGITLDEAKEYRLKLMEERSAMTDERNGEFETGYFNLCEH